MSHVLPAVLRPAFERPGPFRWLLGLVAMMRSRRRLGELEDHRLRDLGLTRREARLEAERVEWNAPAHWLR